MLLAVYFDVSYMNKPQVRSIAGRFFWLKNKSDKDYYIKINGEIHVLRHIIKLLSSSTVKSELGSLFLNEKEVIKL